MGKGASKRRSQLVSIYKLSGKSGYISRGRERETEGGDKGRRSEREKGEDEG